MSRGTGRQTPGEPIALVGMGCRFPGGVTSPREFWDLLVEGTDAVGLLPEHRWRAYEGRGPESDRALRRAVRVGGHLDDIAGFDADFFGISPREAQLMDPQQRVTLEVAWEALEHAAIAPDSLAGSDTSVFMGVCCDDYGRRLLEDLPRLEAWSGIGASMCAVSNRVSHALDLRGASVTVDTACSASLVAVHQACQSLRLGETSLALAGGVMLMAGPSYAIALGAAGALSPDGTSKAFDAAANGYVRSEGCAVLVLKRLADARRDGDPVLAVVRGSAVCQDGRTNGIMAPSRAAQEDLVRLACAGADVDPSSIDYVEAHGTGTGVGDPIEVAALAATVGRDRPADAPCLVGSVKTNIGHLEAASGVAGIIKTVLSLQHSAIPATLGRAGLDPSIPWDETGLRVVTRTTAWDADPARPRRAGIGNYGYGGTLAHVVLEEAPADAVPRHRPGPVDGTARAYPVSGATPDMLRANASRLAARLADDDVDLAATGRTLALGRAGLADRACVVARDRAQLISRLDLLAAGTPAPGVTTGRVSREDAGREVVWIFSGHGAHWAGMGRDLLRTEPALAAVLDEIEDVYLAELGIRPRQVLEAGDLGDVGTVQALTFAMQVGLAAVWRAHGLEPAAVIGHSVGEVAAAVVAGALDLRSAARLICRRSVLLRRTAGRGAMAMVGLSFAEAEEATRGRDGVTAAIAASPGSTVVSGDVAAVEDLLERWVAEGLAPRRVNTDVAFHSAHMDLVVGDLVAATADLAPRSATVPVYSTALPDPRSDAPRDNRYWGANLREPVRFEQAVTAAVEDGYRVFLEISTHPVVAHSAQETLDALGVPDGVVVGSLRRDRPERETLLDALGALHCAGAPVEWSAQHPVRAYADLPTTAWQHRRYWVDVVAEPGAAAARHDVDGHTLLGARTAVRGPAPATLWQTRLDDDTRPYPGRHAVLGSEIVPAAAVLTTFLAAAGADELVDVALRVPLTVGGAREVQVVAQGGALTLSSRPADATDDDAWLTHAVASTVPATGGPAGPLDPRDRRTATPEVLDPAGVMELLAGIDVVGIGWPWAVRELRRSETELLARVDADPAGGMPVATWASLFDAGLSAAPVLFPGAPRLRMPARLAAVSAPGTPPREALVSVRLVDVEWVGGTAAEVEVDVVVTDLSGTVLAQLRGAAFRAVQHERSTADPASVASVTAIGYRLDPLLPEAEQHADLLDEVRRIAAAELRLDPSDLDPGRPLTEAGVDSLLGESIRLLINRRFGTALPSSVFWDRPATTHIATHLFELLTAASDPDVRSVA